MIRALLRSNRGTSLIEFALSLPLLLILLLGGQQLCDAVAAKRKVARATRTVADIGSQTPLQTADEIRDLFTAAAKVLAPYPASQARMRVTQLHTDLSGGTTVVWSVGSGQPALTKGAGYALTGSAANRDTYVIMSEFAYDYRPTSDFVGLGSITFKQRILMNPRRSEMVTCNDC